MAATLDDATKAAIDSLSKSDVSREVSSAFQHKLLWYGIDAFLHFHLMQRAEDITENQISREDFVKRYGLEFEHRWIQPTANVYTGGFYSKGKTILGAVRNDGVYIPKHRVGGLIFFNREYGGEWGSRKWRPEDLEDLELRERAVVMAKSRWKIHVANFEEYKDTSQVHWELVDGQPCEKYSPQPQHVTDLGRKLIQYYSSLMGVSLPQL